MKTSMGGRFGILLPDASLEDVTGVLSYNALADVRLCSKCQNLFHTNERPSDAGSHRVIDVFRAARAGCGFCKVLKCSLEVGYNQSLLAVAGTAGTVEYEARSSVCHLGDRLVVVWDYPPHREMDMLICEILMISAADIPAIPQLSPNTGGHRRACDKLSFTDTSSPASLGLANTWLQYCYTEHRLCRLLLTETGRLPTRLLEIDGKSVRLRNGSELPVQTLYLTLSHCWGTGKTTRLCHNSPLLKGKSLKASELSTTFQHAISVTESLGHRYLWIDSLCIIQDSVKDKQEECSRMWEVYGNSHCTLAATASSDGSGGLFREHAAGGPMACKITPRSEYFNDNGGAGYHFLHDFELIKRIDDSPLCRRGWVTQERLLSPRILHFDSPQVWWECRELCASETYPEGLPNNLDGSVKQQWDPVSVSHTGDIDKCYGAWVWCVRYYSKCHLSDLQDKLVAVAGVARQIGRALQEFGKPDTYLAGLWKNRLPLELLWIHDGENVNDYPPVKYRAPSWSWASVDGAVNWARTEATLSDTDLVSYSLSTSVDSFGPISEGHIRLRGPLARVELRQMTKEAGRKKQSKTTFFRVIASPSSNFEADIWFDDRKNNQLSQSMEIHTLTICRRRETVDGSKGSCTGLILRPTALQRGESGHLNGMFLRLGIFTIDGEAVERFLAVGAQCQDPNLVHEIDNGGGHYTISVI